jgi:hypothetical protein
MTEQEKQKLKDALIEAKHIHPTEYDDEDAFVGICFSDLVDIISSIELTPDAEQFQQMRSSRADYKSKITRDIHLDSQTQSSMGDIEI